MQALHMQPIKHKESHIFLQYICLCVNDIMVHARFEGFMTFLFFFFFFFLFFVLCAMLKFSCAKIMGRRTSLLVFFFLYEELKTALNKIISLYKYISKHISRLCKFLQHLLTAYKKNTAISYFIHSVKRSIRCGALMSPFLP